ncbi:hypothetical protein D1007_18077 [Hordeum vulgare]|nr:hypothetical protein D1007_18077 [Hordeum vulgare]
MVEAEAVDAAVRAATEEEAICARILTKREWRNTRALVREQNRTVCEMSGLPSKEVDEVSDDEDNSGNEQIRLDPYFVLDRYFGEKDDQGSGKGKGSRG